MGTMIDATSGLRAAHGTDAGAPATQTAPAAAFGAAALGGDAPSVAPGDGASASAAPAAYDLVVSGASFTGLVLALGLTQALGPDIRIALVDRAVRQPDPAQLHSVKPDSRCSSLSASSKSVLDVLGVWHAVAPEAQPVTRIEITDSGLDAGIRPVLLTYDNVLESGAPASWILPNAVLDGALLAQVAHHPNIVVLSGREIASFSADDGGIAVRLSDGTELAASLLVAADGRRSVVREMAGLKTVGWGYGQSGIVVTVAHEKPHDGVAVQHFLPAGPFAILPLPPRDGRNRSCITWSEATDEARRIMALDDAGFLAELDRRFGGRLGAVALAGPRAAWPLDVHLARRTVAKRVALAGDAAHGVHPIAGQGLNLAMRDCAALIEVLAETARVGLDIGSAQALERYERWRRFDSLSSTAAFDGLNRLFSNDWTLVRAARDVGLGLVDRLPGVKSWLVREAAGLTGDVPKMLRGELV